MTIIRLQGGLESQHSTDPHKGIFNLLKNLFHAHTHSSRYLCLFPRGFDSLAVFEVSGMQAALHCLPPASFNATRHRVPQAIATRRPPSVPQSTPGGSFLAPGHCATDGSARRRAGRWKEEERGGEDKHWERKMVTGLDNNHLSDECTCVCVTKQVQWPKTNMHGALQNVPWTVKRVSFGNNTHYKRAQPAGGLAEPIFFLPANSEVLSGIASNSSQRVMCSQLKWIYNK